MVLWALAACGGPDTSAPVSEDTGPVDDLDGDGVSAEQGDCDDRDPMIHPGAVETWYDGIDQDCAGDDDYDRDRDGLDAAPMGADCDDADATVFPGATETCDGRDQDCDALVDEGVGAAYFTDADGDGFGAEAAGEGCEVPAGFAAVEGDCDDHRGDIHPAADEVCNGLDDDCTGFADDAAVDAPTWYADADADGFGDALTASAWCEQPAGYVAEGSDCDDADALSWPGAVEVCDLEDNDCDGTADDAAVDPRTYYEDADGDGFGNPDVTASGCGAPPGFVEIDGDCDDADPGLTVEAAWYPDADADGFGDRFAGVVACEAPAGFLADGSDCDDADPAILPGAVEVCDGADNDCDGGTDDAAAVDPSTFYVDADLDGYGSPAAAIAACELPAGYAETADDCDDADPSANPGNRESCDGVDNDCDTEVDESDATDVRSWHPDADGDGFGDGSSAELACDAPPDTVEDASDCDDTDASVNPTGAETRDLADEDCDGWVDEDFIAVGDVVISEVARQPWAGGSGTSTNVNAQWFEVYNASAAAIDLANWTVEEQDGDTFDVPSLVIAAGGHAVLCYDDAWNTACDFTWGDSSWGPPYYDLNFYFDRDEDLVSVSLDGVEIDRVHWTYDATNGYWPRVAHYSMELDVLDATANDDETNWCQASSSDAYITTGTGAPDYGTPGAGGGC